MTDETDETDETMARTDGTDGTIVADVTAMTHAVIQPVAAVT